MSDKAVKREAEKLKEQIKAIEFCKDVDDEIRQIKQYNAMVVGIHNYYRYATAVNLDCMTIQFQLNTVLYNRLKARLKKQGVANRKYIAEHYGESKMLRYISGEPLCPIGYVQTKNPMFKKKDMQVYGGRQRRNSPKSEI